MLINDVTKQYHISARTLRYYEEIELLESSRNESDRRIYDHNQLKRLEDILLYKSLGFKLESIKGILNGHYILKDVLFDHLHELEASLNALKYQRDVLLTAIQTYGSDNLNKHNLDTFLQQQIYLKDERWLNMTAHNVTIEIGQELIPLALRENEPNLLTAIENLRKSVKSVHNILFEKVRVRDVLDNLMPTEFQISVGDNVLIQYDLKDLSKAQQIDTIITHLKSIVLKHA